jgi:hypothetical protein
MMRLRMDAMSACVKMNGPESFDKALRKQQVNMPQSLEFSCCGVSYK